METHASAFARWMARTTTAALFGALAVAGGCTETNYRNDLPFSCENDHQCPEGFTCVSDLCVRPGSRQLPPLLARSPSPILPRLLPDVDRGGTVGCWTVREEVGTSATSVYASFNDAMGAVQSVKRLVTLDTRGQRFIGACAPIPNSGGSVLVALWLQRDEGVASADPLRGAPTISEMRLMVWEPAEPRGTGAGAARPLYSEVSPDVEPTPNRLLELDIFDNQVLVPMIWSLGMPPGSVFRIGAELSLNVLAVGAQEAREGRVVRRALGGTRAAFRDTVSRVRAGETGIWLNAGEQRALLGFATQAGGVFREMPASSETLIRPLVAARLTPAGMMMPVEQLAVLWPDDLENNGGTLLRVGWFRPFASVPQIGPRLPFRRVETPDPAAVVIGSDLYVFGTPIGAPVEPMGLDGGVSDAAVSEAGVVADAGSTPDGSSGGAIGAFTVYRVPWGADSAAAVEAVQTVEPRVAPAQVIAASAARIPGQERGVQVAWVEFYPPDGGRRGARYALYTSRIVLR